MINQEEITLREFWKEKNQSQCHQTFTRGCPETSPGDGALAIKIARDTTHKEGRKNQNNNHKFLTDQMLKCLSDFIEDRLNYIYQNMKQKQSREAKIKQQKVVQVPL